MKEISKVGKVGWWTALVIAWAAIALPFVLRIIQRIR